MNESKPFSLLQAQDLAIDVLVKDLIFLLVPNEERFREPQRLYQEVKAVLLGFLFIQDFDIFLTSSLKCKKDVAPAGIQACLEQVIWLLTASSRNKRLEKT